MFDRSTTRLHRSRLIGLIALILGLMAFFANGTPAHAQEQLIDPRIYGSEFLFLPVVSNVSTEPVCNNSAEEIAIADLLITDARQSRAVLTCNPLLVDVARQRAADMAQRDYFDHVNPDGAGPNSMVRSAGYRLPDYYDQSPPGNNVESIAAGFDTAEATWEGWVNSPHHRSHVLAEEPFFTEQSEYGIGYYYEPNSYYQHYWVLLTALPDSP